MKSNDVLFNILTSDNIVANINSNIDILTHLIPEIRYMIDFSHNNHHHHLDVWNHTLLALSLSENNFEMRLCLLLHDIGKLHCFQDLEIRHFKGHPKVSSEISKKILERLNYETNFIDEVCYLIEKHDSLITIEEISNNYDLEYKRFKIQYCDSLAHNPNKIDNRKRYLERTLNKFEKNKVLKK